MSDHWKPYGPTDAVLTFYCKGGIPKLEWPSRATPPAEYREWKAIVDSADRAVARLWNKQYPINADSLSDDPEKKLLAELKLAHTRKWLLGNAHVGRFIAAAWHRRDKRFFIRLGKVLAKSPMTGEAPQRHKLREFLATNWAGFNPKMPDLCFFNDAALIELCCIALSMTADYLTIDVIRHERKGLGLKKSSTILIRKVRQKAGKIVLS